MNFISSFKNYDCECCKGSSAYLNGKRCDDCHYLKIVMRRNIEVTEKIYKEIKKELKKRGKGNGKLK